VYYELFREATRRWAAQQHEPLLLARLRGYRRDPEQKFATIARLPVTAVDHAVRTGVKKLIHFKD